MGPTPKRICSEGLIGYKIRNSIRSPPHHRNNSAGSPQVIKKKVLEDFAPSDLISGKGISPQKLPHLNSSLAKGRQNWTDEFGNVTSEVSRKNPKYFVHLILFTCPTTATSAPCGTFKSIPVRVGRKEWCRWDPLASSVEEEEERRRRCRW